MNLYSKIKEECSYFAEFIVYLFKSFGLKVYIACMAYAIIGGFARSFGGKETHIINGIIYGNIAFIGFGAVLSLVTYVVLLTKIRMNINSSSNKAQRHEIFEAALRWPKR